MRRDGQEFDCATWLHKARLLPKKQFRREAEKELKRLADIVQEGRGPGTICDTVITTVITGES